MRVEGLFVTPLVEAMRPSWSERRPSAAALAAGTRGAPTVGWEPCAPDEPGAREDLNRWIWFVDHGYDGRYDR